MTIAAATSPLQAPVTHLASGRVFNFSAGPAVLPEEVLKQVQQDVWDIRGTGIGMLEHSHRNSTFDAVLAEAFADCKALFGAHWSDEYDVLFLPGGATLQFAMIPLNWLPVGAIA
ncbi:MAG: aminotransferase class V-fold PLP-dependent enzyme, partial [Phycisphaerae bacterium]|nr:aminotransferase class V-fold PLP-dependent enzyme [Phycisphaerae bacterium]